MIIICSGGDSHTLFLGRHPGDAKVQRGGDTAEGGGDESPRHADADAHAALPGPEKLLHRRVRVIQSS